MGRYNGVSRRYRDLLTDEDEDVQAERDRTRDCYLDRVYGDVQRALRRQTH
jgi:hypothetical protein